MVKKINASKISLENRKYSLWYKLPGDNNKVERVKKKTENVLNILDQVWDDILDGKENSTPKIIFDFTKEEEKQEQVENTSVVISPMDNDKGVGAKRMSSSDNGNKQSKKRKGSMQKGGWDSISDRSINKNTLKGMTILLNRARWSIGKRSVAISDEEIVKISVDGNGQM